MALVDIAIVLGIALLTVCAAIFAIVRMEPAASGGAALEDHRVALLFDGPDLADATAGANFAFDLPEGDVTWAVLRGTLQHQFADLPAALSDLTAGVHRFAARGGDRVLMLDRAADRSVLTIDAGEDGPDGASERVAQLEAECATLRRAVASAPHPVWEANLSGHVTWCNAAYEALRAEVGQDTDDTAPLFETGHDIGKVPQRVRAQVARQADGSRIWFDLVQQRMDGVIVSHAMDIEAVIRAEVAQRNFVQTLAKTFAQLSIGLAIFDRNGQLALFNPALVDLTTLPAEFLSGRPDLPTFFDQLRDKRMMPEPKSYTSWREQIAGLIAAAEDGRYQETWTLESGQTYRVSGRPHPDRAIAFLIEDISAEMLLTRNFRAELELGQSLVDSLSDPIAVFTNTGVLTLSNAAYRVLFKVDPDSSFADVTVIDAMRDWQAIAAPSPVWGEIRDFVQDMGERTTWDANVQMQDGTRWTCHLKPIAGGATALRLTPEPIRLRELQT
ncbi:MAG: PAS-domain containing protein [Pseudomonadota bacterium]